MTRTRLFCAILIVGLVGASAQADPPAGPRLPPSPNPLELLRPGSTDALAGAFRGYLVKNFPGTLYESSHDWGRTVPVNRVEWKGKGLHVHPEKVRKDKNHGDWRKLVVTADNLADSLVFDLRDLDSPEPGRLTFTIFLAFDANVTYDHQKWDEGLKLWDSTTKARLRVKATLHCEVTARLEDSGALLPDAVLRLRVVKADLGYDNLVVEHIAGIGGAGAKLMGETIKGTLREVKPNLERDLLAKADAAIVKAGDTKEVRVRLGDLLRKKGVAKP